MLCTLYLYLYLCSSPPQVGRVLHKDMKGGLSGDAQSPATLTAYVLIALLEARPYVSIPVSHFAIVTSSHLNGD